MSQILDNDIKFLPGVGPRRAELLGKELNITTFNDLLNFYPFRYVDRSKIYTISEIEPSMSYIQLRGVITRISLTGEKRGKRLIATFTDPTGSLDLVFFRGIKAYQNGLRTNKEYIIFGKPTLFNQSINIVHPEIESVTDEAPLYSGNMMGIYPGTEKLRNNGIGNKQIAKYISHLVKNVLPYVEETLSDHIISRERLMPLPRALFYIHFPPDMKQLASARLRLKFEELFYVQLSLLKIRNKRILSYNGLKFNKVGKYFNTAYSNIPFELTNAQKRVIKEMRADMVSGRQMNRLLQGDVGSGKTLVAVLCAMIAADNGFQSCIMAPTEVLANQHYNGIKKILAETGIESKLLTGSTKTKERREIYEGIASGKIDLLFGTHALIEDKVNFERLGFVVIDEQHRFGVEQRAKLWNKSELLPHVLVMTATPIPRTLAMTLYGDLDVSVIDELPPGRKPVVTLHANETQRRRIFAFMKEQIKAGRQIFVVYPLIKESEKLDYKNLQEGYEHIIEEFPAPEYVTAVVHGQQKNEDKAYDMKLFAEGKANILVSTSVIEVGVDVPNASVMLIESAERFGLSQLHQLRGRVGRGSEKSYCILMTGYKLSKESKQRVDLMCSTNDGFELAEADLKMRGPGDIEGTQQSGVAFDLKISNLSTDWQIMEKSRMAAQYLLDNDPDLSKSENSCIINKLKSLKNEIKDYSQIS